MKPLMALGFSTRLIKRGKKDLAAIHICLSLQPVLKQGSGDEVKNTPEDIAGKGSGGRKNGKALNLAAEKVEIRLINAGSSGEKIWKKNWLIREVLVSLPSAQKNSD
jgi:hypothetical protein